jgi:isopenicillin-N N-acyltransferase like protein
MPRRVRHALIVLAALALALSGAHFAIGCAAKLHPPEISVEQASVATPAPGVRTIGRSSARRRGAIFEVRLEGGPEQIGYTQTRLMYDEMVENEGTMLGQLERKVSLRLVRTLLFDLAQLRYRNVDQGMSADRRREIAASALGFQPDPYRGLFPTYQRFVYLNALYDISLSFEHSPLIGCTSLTFSGAAAAGGHALLARAFDFEVSDVFDQKKAVFLVREQGKIPFASVAWPGLVGVVSGMNAEGLALVVHGGRAGRARAQGEPVVHALRRALSTARTTDEAIDALANGSAMVSHIVIATDAAGRSAAIERVPGEPEHVRRLPARAAVTNHFEGPAASDAANQRVESATSTLDRRRRADELLAEHSTPVAAADAVRMLRDRRGPGGIRLPLGDRRAIDALIATHGVVMDATERVVWVSESPHLLGRFVAFDLKRLLADDYDPLAEPELSTIPADPMLGNGDYARFRDQAR